MDAMKRREQITEIITSSSQPVTGGELALRMGVTRQVVVQDIALLRAQGLPVVATPSGYIYIGTSARARPVRVFTCRHDTPEEARRELMIIVSKGGMVRDVIIEHPVYGEISGTLMLRTPEAVEHLIARLSTPGSKMLSSVTGGIHMHTVEAADGALLDDIESELRQAGIII